MPQQEQSFASKTVECDVSKMDVDGNGISDYYWPVSNQERIGFGVYLMTSYADILKSYDSRQFSDVLPYRFFGVHFLAQVMAIFQGDLLCARAREDSVNFNFSNKNWRYWPFLWEEKSPQEPNLIEVLKNGPVKTNKSSLLNFSRFKRVFKLLNFKRGGIHVDGLKIKPLSKKVLESNVVTTQRTPLIIEHALAYKKDVVFSRSDKWFSKISNQEFLQSKAENIKSLEENIIRMIEDGYKKYGIELKPYSRSFLQNLLDKAPALCRVHYQRLLENPDKLPKEIWTGTAGQYWDTMLRVAVMQYGGKAFGHDHGSGAAHVRYPLRGIAEYWGCDTFFTFNKNAAQEMAETAASYPRYDSCVPKIKHVSPSNSVDVLRGGDRKTKTIFFMISLYDNDRGRIGPGTPNNFLVDWQARLIKKLKDLGYDVLVKIHPETKVMPPKVYEDLGAKITKVPFKDVMDQADMVIFDCIFTTAFTDCLKTNIPIVLIDFFDFPWTERGGNLIQKRCEIVQSEYKNCRAKPDWNAIEQAIKVAPEKCHNHEFYKTYFC